LTIAVLLAVVKQTTPIYF